MTKWASRFSLGLSTSVPGLRLKPSNIVKENEISMLVVPLDHFEKNQFNCLS